MTAMQDDNATLIESVLHGVTALDKDIALADYELRKYSSSVLIVALNCQSSC